MESSPAWRTRFSFRNATILLCSLNIVAALFLLHGFFSLSSRRGTGQSDPAQIRYIIESEEIRRAMEPLELIKRVKEIEQEAYTGQETEAHQVPKQTAAIDLSKRLKDLRTTNDANSQKALEEWRRRKTERARQREIEKNGTLASQAQQHS